MNVDLSKAEVELLEQALVAWESEAMSSGMTGALLSAMLPGSSKEDRRAEMERELNAAKADGQKRRVKGVMLRAKLMQALSRESEHDVSPL